MVDPAVLKDLVSESTRARMFWGLSGIVGETSANYYAEDSVANALMDFAGETGVIENPHKWVYSRAIVHCHKAMGNYKKERVTLNPRRSRLFLQCSELPEEFLKIITPALLECVRRKLANEPNMPSRVYQNIRFVLKKFEKWEEEAEERELVSSGTIPMPEQYRVVYARIKSGASHASVAADLGLSIQKTRYILYTVRLRCQEHAARLSPPETPAERRIVERVIAKKIQAALNNAHYRETHRKRISEKRRLRWIREGR